MYIQQRRTNQQYIHSPQLINYSPQNELNDINIENSIPITNVSISNNICRISKIKQQNPHYNRQTTPIYNANPNIFFILNVAMSSHNVNVSAMMNNNMKN